MTEQTIPQIPGLDLQAYMTFVVDPSNTQAILNVQKEMLKAPNRPEMIQWVMKSLSDESFKQLLNERYVPELPTNQQLLETYKPGSMGRALAEHLISNNITLDFSGLDLSMFYGKDLNPVVYFGMRGIRIHDIIHVLLGLGVTPVDEYCVASFTLAQFRSPYHMQLVGTGYMHVAFFEPENIPKFLDGIHHFYNLGLKAKFVTGYRFEDNLHLSVAEVRKQLNVLI